jgi:hypothetical protein
MMFRRWYLHAYKMIRALGTRGGNINVVETSLLVGRTLLLFGTR